MRAWLWRHRDILLWLLIEGDLLFALFPLNLHVTQVLLARFAVGSFVWWVTWSKLWRKYCFRPLRGQRRRATP